MKRVRSTLLIVVGVAFGAAAALFVYANPQSVELNFLNYRLSEPVPIWQVIGLSALAGMIIPRLLMWGVFWERYKARRQLFRKLKALEREVVKLRNLPLQDLPTAPAPASRQEPPRPQARHTEGRRVEGHSAHLAQQPAQDFDYEGFLSHGEGFDHVEAQAYRPAQQPELLPREADMIDPYAAAFDVRDPAVADMEDAHVYPSVVGPSGRRKEG